MQNLHILCLRGFHGQVDNHILELQLSTLPNLRTLKLLNIDVRNQTGINGITKLEDAYTLAPRVASGSRGVSTNTDYTIFPKLRTYRSIIFPPASIKTTHNINVILKKLLSSADTLTNLELMKFGKWAFRSIPNSAFARTFNNLATMCVPSTKLIHLDTLTPEFGVNPSTIQRFEVVVLFNHSGRAFCHLLKNVVSYAVAHLKPHFPNLKMVKLALADTMGKNWCGPIQLFLALMDHVVSRGAFMKHKVVRGGSGSRGFGCIELDNGLVIDYFQLMRYMARHDVDWVWPACS